MNSFSKLTTAFLSFGLLLGQSACDSSSDSFDPQVENSSVDDNQLQVGDSTILKVGLDFDRNGRLFNDTDDIKLVIKLPFGVRYRTGTAELQGLSDDEEVKAVVTNCDATGEQYLEFDIDGDDLDDASDPSGGADAEVRLIIDATSPTQGIGVIELQANEDNVLFACGSSFASQSDSSIQVL